MPFTLTPLKNLYHSHRRLTVLVTVALVAVLLFGASRLFRRSDTQYFTATVERGNLVAVVNATGTIDAVITVEVGSQVSGMIAALYADFNSEVKKGELIAQIDPAPFRARVLQAEADLINAEAGVKSLEADLALAKANREKARAALREAELNLRRTLELFEQKIASVQQRDSVQIAYETAQANMQAAEAQINQSRARLEQQRAQVKQRQAQLEQVRLDLQHTRIHAPIDGTVINRNVDVGQTVAASLQAPTLFTIAQDLTQMLVYAKTDESDVGRIRLGARARFNVDSFPDDTFHGRVKQVRMNAYQVQNVVTYDTIIEFENPELKLLPGMTAYVTIRVANARDVVKIPNGALRFKPELPVQERHALLQKYGLLGPPANRGREEGTVQGSEKTSRRPGEPESREGVSEEQRARWRERLQGMSPQERAQARGRGQARHQPAEEEEGSFPARPRSGPEAQGKFQIVWKLNPDNFLQPVRVKTGLTDFTFTAMLEGDLQPGDKLVIGQVVKGRSRSPLGRVPRRF